MVITKVRRCQAQRPHMHLYRHLLWLINIVKSLNVTTSKKISSQLNSLLIWLNWFHFNYFLDVYYINIFMYIIIFYSKKCHYYYICLSSSYFEFCSVGIRLSEQVGIQKGLGVHLEVMLI